MKIHISVSDRFRVFLLSAVWVFAAIIYGGQNPVLRPLFDHILLMFVLFMIPAVLTYRMFMRASQPEKEKTTTRSVRVHEWLASLDDDELDTLRDRLSDDGEMSLDSLLTEKRKRDR